MVDRGVSGRVLRNVDERALVDSGVGVNCRDCGVDERGVM